MAQRNLSVQQKVFPFFEGELVCQVWDQASRRAAQKHRKAFGVRLQAFERELSGCHDAYCETASDVSQALKLIRELREEFEHIKRQLVDDADWWKRGEEPQW